MKLKDIFSKGEDDQWIAISDMMAGLMVVFLLIAIISIVGGEKKDKELESTIINLKSINEENKSRNDYLQSLNAELTLDIKNLKNEIESQLSHMESQNIEYKSENESLSRLNKDLKSRVDSLSSERKKQLEYIESQKIKLVTDIKNTFSSVQLDKYGAVISKDGKVTFYGKYFMDKTSDKGLFADGSWAISDNFQETLNDFFPRYIHKLSKYSDYIEEIKIVGHTSSTWPPCENDAYRNNKERSYGSGKMGIEKCKYVENMGLSQKRASSVLNHVLNISPSTFGFSTPFRSYKSNISKLKKHISGVGRSDSDKISMNQIEDESKSRRIHFEVKLNVETIIRNYRSE